MSSEAKKTSAPKTKKQKRAALAKWLILGSLLVGIPTIIVLYHSLWHHFWRVEHAATNSLLGEAKIIFNGRITKAEDIPDFVQRTRATETARIELHQNEQLAVGNIPRGCAEDYRAKDGKITFTVSACQPGTPVWLQLPNQFQERVYAVTLYKFGYGGKLIKVVGEPLIKVIKPDGFSEATRLSPKDVVNPVDFKIRGNAEYVADGNADFVEMIENNN